MTENVNDVDEGVLNQTEEHEEGAAGHEDVDGLKKILL